jgi:hypothetical protein
VSVDKGKSWASTPMAKQPGKLVSFCESVLGELLKRSLPWFDIIMCEVSLH